MCVDLFVWNILLLFFWCQEVYGDISFLIPDIGNLEKEMATHSSVVAWRIPGTGEPGGLPSMGSHRVKHDWSDLAVAAVAVSIGNLGLSRWHSGKESACQGRRHRRLRGFYPWVGKIPWRRKWHPTPVFLPGEFHGQQSLTGCNGVANSWTQLSAQACLLVMCLLFLW